MPVQSPAAPEVEFAPHFTARRAAWSRDSTDLERAYRLRFDVYCVDCAYLDATDYPTPRETDLYDDQSTHFFAYNLGDELVGYVRLVHHVSQRPFPWQLYCRDLLAGVALPEGDQCAEVSRLMVRRDYRRRATDLVTGIDTAADEISAVEGGERRRRSPQIMLSLYRQMYQHSRPAGIRYWFAAMERPLARALQGMGFTFQRIGAEVDYFGPVAPYLADIDQLEAALAAKNPSLLAWMRATPR
jgi:N-acyl amino acid synthase of PEP-CTERM/exosortase system